MAAAGVLQNAVLFRGPDLHGADRARANSTPAKDRGRSQRARSAGSDDVTTPRGHVPRSLADILGGRPPDVSCAENTAGVGAIRNRAVRCGGRSPPPGPSREDARCLLAFVEPVQKLPQFRIRELLDRLFYVFWLPIYPLMAAKNSPLLRVLLSLSSSSSMVSTGESGFSTLRRI